MAMAQRREAVEKERELKRKAKIYEVAENVMEIVKELSKASIDWDSAHAEIDHRASIFQAPPRLSNIIVAGAGDDKAKGVNRVGSASMSSTQVELTSRGKV